MRGLLWITCAVAIATNAIAQPPADAGSVGRDLDTKLFESYNSCDLVAFGELVVDAVRENILAMTAPGSAI